MDCCNYMQYRHHQPYYGSQYYEPMASPCHGDFYGHHVYQEYYGNASYYPQQWQCANSFPDYVYNTKEARIRKAMRDTARERSIGGSPMLQRPNPRRVAHGWGSPQEDHLMMSPLGEMRPSPMEPQVCGFRPGGPPYLDGPHGGYNKLEPPAMPPSAVPNYMQSNPLAQLQQHTEMWPDYQNMRPRSSVQTPGPQFLMGGDIAPQYQPAPRDLPHSMMMEKPAISSPIATNEVLVPQEAKGNIIENGRSPQNQFMPVFEQDDMNQRNQFDKIEKTQVKKPVGRQVRTPTTKKPTSKPLPDFNEAFGSTERGRFQSPPDPRLAPNKGYLDYFFDDYQI